MVELVNSLVSFYDKQPINLIAKARKGKDSKSKSTSSKELPKARMRTQIIFNLVRRMKEKMASTQDEPTLILWLSAVIEKISQEFIANKRDLVLENQQDGSLLKVQANEHMWRWNNILKSLSLSKDKNFDLQVLSSCLDLLSNLIHFERLQYKWEVHQKQMSLKEEPKEKQNIAEKEKELIKTIHNSDISELRTENKNKLKKFIPSVMFNLKSDQIQAPLQTILRLLCQDEMEYISHQHTAVYDYYFMQIKELSSVQMSSISYEKLFSLINMLKTLWIKFASKQPGLWRTYAIENSEVLQMLFKIAMKTVEQAAQPCL